MGEQEKAVFVTMRVADSPEAAVPSSMLVCDRCQQPVWCDVRNLSKLPELNAGVVCNRCIVPDLARGELSKLVAMVGGEQMTISKDVADEFVAWHLEEELGRG